LQQIIQIVYNSIATQPIFFKKSGYATPSVTLQIYSVSAIFEIDSVRTVRLKDELGFIPRMLSLS